jgi:hypothetical protein
VPAIYTDDDDQGEEHYEDIKLEVCDGDAMFSRCFDDVIAMDMKFKTPEVGNYVFSQMCRMYVHFRLHLLLNTLCM